MQVNREVRMRAKALGNEPLYKDAAKFLQDRAVNALLSAKTIEEREEKWREYHALKGVVGLIATWAAEADKNT